MSTDDHICVKLGRTTDPEEPLRRWRSQCPSSQIKLGGLWPASTNQSGKATGGISSAQMIDYCSTLEGEYTIRLVDLMAVVDHLVHSQIWCASSLRMLRSITVTAPVARALANHLGLSANTVSRHAAARRPVADQGVTS